MTANDIIATRARRLISDVVPDSNGQYRWSPAVLLVYLHDALDMLWTLRPDAFYVDGVVTEQPTNPATTSKVVSVKQRFAFCLANGVSSIALSEDSEDTINLDLSKKYRDEFQTLARTI